MITYAPSLLLLAWLMSATSAFAAPKCNDEDVLAKVKYIATCGERCATVLHVNSMEALQALSPDDIRALERALLATQPQQANEPPGYRALLENIDTDMFVAYQTLVTSVLNGMPIGYDSNIGRYTCQANITYNAAVSLRAVRPDVLGGFLKKSGIMGIAMLSGLNSDGTDGPGSKFPFMKLLDVAGQQAFACMKPTISYTVQPRDPDAWLSSDALVTVVGDGADPTCMAQAKAQWGAQQ